ncbi:MAG: electron transport complex subunit RsxC [Eubacterium sp.]|nr:electron transport complex subunit RsxC [Eubacterium sp.]
MGFIKTFSGGVHPEEGKDLSKDLPVRKVFPKDQVVIPCSMHIGAPAKPIVEVGEHVLNGQLIAEASSFISANVHSSVSGTVKAIEDRELVGDGKGLCIVIENDKKQDRFEYKVQPSPWSKEYIREAVKDCGVVGMGGACFPTHVKITPKDDEAIDHVIINACECEPYITADYRRMIENPEELIEGLKIMLTLFPNAKGYIAIEDNKQDCIDLFKKLTASEDLIEVVPMKTKYPQGSERHVIYAINKRKMNSSMLPADVGCIVDNVDTVYNIYQAVKFHKPLTSRIMTVSGDAFYQPCNLEVSLGMSYQEVVDEMNGMCEDAKKVIAGGPMMGQAMYNLDVPITKGSSSLLAFMEDDYDKAPKTNCMNCGMCVRVCPQKLVCANLAKLAEADNMEDFVKCYGMECIECGTCNYICPAKRNLTQSIKTMKQKVIAKRKGEKK